MDAFRERIGHLHRWHFYASVLLDGGESIKALSEYLGHADPAFTLRTYTHLMPSSSERTRRAVDGVFQMSAPEPAEEGPAPAPEGEDSGPPTAWRRPGDGLIMSPEPKTASKGTALIRRRSTG